MRFGPLLRWLLCVLGLLLLVGSCVDERSAGTPPAERARPAPTSVAVSTALRAAHVAAVQGGAAEAYRIEPEPAGSGFRAQSAAQGFRTEFRAHGVEVSPAPADDAGWTWDATPARWGCDDELSEIDDVQPSAQGNRVDYRREGLSEWYLSGPLGLEQGFTLATPPACRGRGGQGVVIALRGGGLEASIVDEGKTAVLRDGGGRAVLRYSDLYVVDATGKELAAELRTGPKGISIRFEDRDAAYPVTVDPLIWVQQAELLAIGGAVSDDFGRSVALSEDGNTAVVGAPAPFTGLQGAAYVFVRTGGAWSLQQKLSASDGAADDLFGYSVVISGDTVVVGAPGSLSVQGAYVFVRTAGSWSQQQKLTASDGAQGDWFGYSVAVSGDTAVVGAFGQGFFHGEAYVFVRNGTSWSEQQTLTGGAGHQFGWSVAVDGDTAVVGENNSSSQGAAYVFLRVNSVWSPEQTLTASDGMPDALFGNSVAINGNTAVVGATNSGGSLQGAAYVFFRVNSSWSEQQKLTPDDSAPDNEFGESVAISGDTAVVGANKNGASHGATYVFVRDGATSAWSQQQRLTAPPGLPNDQFGRSVAVSGTTAIVGEAVKASAKTVAYVFALVPPLIAGAPCVSSIDCATGFCVTGVCCSVASCPASNACNTGVCMVGTGLCGNKPLADGSACDDSNLCTQIDTCQAGACTGNSPLPCSAPDVCHTAACAPPTGVCTVAPVADGTSCDDGNLCTQAGTCQAGACKGQSAIVCSAPDACHDAYCDPTSGQCASQPKINGASCDDGIACTQLDTCQNGFCVGGAVCPALDACHLPGTCDPTTGCHNPPGPDGTPCDDGNACTGFDACQSGVCAGAPTSCPWLDSCHPGICDPASGACSNPYSPACGDGGSSVPVGATGCTADKDCPGSFCVDQVCCDTQCSDKCSSCALPGHVGHCTPEPTGVDLRHDCGAGTDCTSTCGPGGACVGAGKDTQCEPSRCTDASHGLGPASCSAQGAPCPLEARVPFDCGRYRCTPAFGACFTVCQSVADCAPGSVCDPTGTCAPPPSVASEQGAGCSVAVPGPAPSGAWWAMLGIVVAAAGARRGAQRRRIPWILFGFLLLTGSCRDGRSLTDTEDTPLAVAVDPLIAVSQGELLPNDGAVADNIGVSVAISGETAIVGSPQISNPQGNGKAYVFTRSGALWSQQQELLAPNGAPGDFFGFSVAVSGDTAVVGAPGLFSNTTGKAYVFVRAGSSWIQQPPLLAADAAVGDGFGASVSISGDTVVVGAPMASANQPGKAYVFVRVGGVWSQQQELAAAIGAASDSFGLAAAVSGDTAVVGAPGLGMNQQGRAHVFLRSGSSWTLQQELAAADGTVADHFGGSVALDGDTAIVGRGGLLGQQMLNQQGKAYVFVRSGVSWSPQQTLSVAGGVAGDAFGASVALSGDTAVVGAIDAADIKGADKAYLFVRSGASWSQQQALVAANTSAGDGYGTSVALNGDTAIVGAPIKASFQGAAYVFVQKGSSGDACSGAGQCLSGFCVDSVCCSVPACPASDACHTASCSPGTGLCASLTKSDGTSCDDGNTCTQPGTCQLGVCKGQSPLVCSAPDSCHDAYCDPASGQCVTQARAEGASCNSGYACAQAGVCQSGACNGASPIVCPAPDPCHDVVCHPAMGTCTLTAKADGAACDDHDACSQADACQGGVCKGTSAANGTACDDHDPCTASAACQSGACVGGAPVVCTPLDACHDQGTCIPLTGLCSNPLKPSCDPGLDGGTQGGGVVAPGGVQICAAAAACATGHCADGVCCDTDCQDTCSSCVLPGHVGQCTPEPTGVDLRHDCGAAGSCLGTCGPGGSCIGAGTGTQCVANHCTDASHGVGPAYCPSEGMACAADAAVSFDCGAFRCEPAVGACYASCQSVAECAPGWVCDPSARCVRAPDVAAGNDVSCGVAAAGFEGEGEASGCFAALLLALALRRKRRRIADDPRAKERRSRARKAVSPW